MKTFSNGENVLSNFYIFKYNFSHEMKYHQNIFRSFYKGKFKIDKIVADRKNDRNYKGIILKLKGNYIIPYQTYLKYSKTKLALSTTTNISGVVSEVFEG